MKKLAIALVCILLVVGVVGGTLAWLTDTTAPVVNTFTASNIEITLDETTGPEYKMVPGCEIEKDPVVTVTGGSEKCYLFVKLEKSANFDQFMAYAVADGWTKLTGVEGVDNVYYREVAASDIDQSFDVIEDDKITVSETVTKEQMNGLTEATYPTLTVTAYAAQYAKNNTENFTAAEAWAVLNPPANP